MTTYEAAAWLALVAAISAVTAWGLTELVMRRWLGPLKIRLRQTGGEPGWWWSGLVASIAMAIGAVGGAVAGAVLPLDSAALGAVVGLAAGAQPAWIVRIVHARARQLRGEGGE